MRLSHHLLNLKGSVSLGIVNGDPGSEELVDHEEIIFLRVFYVSFMCYSIASLTASLISFMIESEVCNQPAITKKLMEVFRIEPLDFLFCLIPDSWSPPHMVKFQ